MRRWPTSIRRTVLLVGFLAIGSYINFEILDVDGSRLTTPFIAVWTDFEASSDQAEQIIQDVVSALDLLPTDWITCSAWTPPRLGLPIQPRSPRIVSGISRTPGAARITSPSADPV